MFSRIYSSVLAVLHIEVVANAIFQSRYLTDGSWWLLLLVTIPILGMVANSWLRGSLSFWAYLHGATVLFAIWCWPAIVVDVYQLPSNFQAWVWWLVGTATISMGVTKLRWLGWLYLVLASGSWMLLDTSLAGGLGEISIALQDSVYVFLLGGTVSELVRLTRDGAKRADAANASAIARAVEQAQTDATERERQRIDALVHDRVLNTLLLAARASTPADQLAAAQAASEAIQNLESAVNEQDLTSKVTTLGLYRSLRKAALRLSGETSVEIVSAGLEQIPAEAAQAITEATLQALDNALRHSQAESTRLILGGSEVGGISVKVVDDGKGFNIERLPKDRLGIRTSIEARMRLVGGEAKISSQPGRGTSVELRWSN